jgi:hypothetical protein
MRLFKKCLCAYPVVAPRRQPGGPSALSRLGRTNRKARLGRTGMGCRPEPFFVAPNEVRGVLRRLRASGGQIGKRASGGQGWAVALSPFLSPRAKRGMPR